MKNNFYKVFLKKIIRLKNKLSQKIVFLWFFFKYFFKNYSVATLKNKLRQKIVFLTQFFFILPNITKCKNYLCNYAKTNVDWAAYKINNGRSVNPLYLLIGMHYPTRILNVLANHIFEFHFDQFGKTNKFFYRNKCRLSHI